MYRLAFLLALLLAAAPLALAQEIPVTTDSEEARAYFEDARLAYAHIDRARTPMLLAQALEADPDFAHALLYLAMISPPPQRPALMERAMAQVASDGERMMLEAYAAILADDSERARVLLREAADAYPDDPYPAFFLARTLRSEERYAVAAAQMAIDADEDFAPIYNGLGYTHLEREDYAAAEEAFEAYVRLAPDVANAYDSLGEYYLTVKRYDDAKVNYERSLELDPESPSSQGGLAHVEIVQINQA